VALSYGWGSTPNLTAVQANVELFQQPGSLDREEIDWQIPTCIRDAIVFTELLNERYPCVDSLCIARTRRRENLPHCEIVRMASIYANVALTIVTANEKTPITACEAFKVVSFPRRHSQRTVELSNGARVVEYYLLNPNKAT
jgi:hypothetical protein